MRGMSDPKPFCPPETPPTWIRPRGFRIPRVELAITVDLERKRVEGTVKHRVERLPHGARERTLCLDQHDLEIASVLVDGAPVEHARGDGRLALVLPEPLADWFDVEIAFAVVDPPKGMLFIPADAQRGEGAMAWTQGAMEDHSWWFPCFDTPNNLATYRIAIRHRANLVGIANGDRESRVEHGDGWATTTWVQSRSHVLYLLNVVVGDFVAVDDASGSAPVAHWLPRGHEAKSAAMFRATGF